MSRPLTPKLRLAQVSSEAAPALMDGPAAVCSLLSNWLTTYRDLARMPEHPHVAHNHVAARDRVRRNTSIADELARLIRDNYADECAACGSATCCKVCDGTGWDPETNPGMSGEACGACGGSGGR